MNIGFFSCAILGLFFFLFGLLFWGLKGRAAILISGFNTFSKEKRELYDTTKMVLDQRNTFFLWAVIMGIGAVLSYFLSQYIAIVAYIVWLIIFFKDVHMDAEKAFARYKRNS